MKEPIGSHKAKQCDPILQPFHELQLMGASLRPQYSRIDERLCVARDVKSWESGIADAVH